MTQQAFTFEKLGIDSKSWDITYADNNCGYTFTTPADGVLFLRSAGKLRQEIVSKQIQFIENYHLQINQRIVNYKTVLVWDFSDLFGLKSFQLIKKQLENLSIDVTIVFPGKFIYKLILSVWKKKNESIFGLFPSSINEALAFARNIKSAPDQEDTFKGRFAEFWTKTRYTKKIGNKVYRYLELPDWQYESQDKTLKTKVLFFDNHIILYEIEGRVSAIDVQVLQQKVVEISNQLEIDLRKQGFFVIFDVRKVNAIDSQARKLMRTMEQNQHHLSNGVIVMANPMINYLLSFRKRLYPERYDHWKTAKSLKAAFSIIEMKNMIIETQPFSNLIRIQPAQDYNELKKQFQKLQSDYNALTNKYNSSVSNIRKVLSFINAGDFLITPFKARFNDESIEGEVYNSFALLHNDLKKNKISNLHQNFEIGFTYSNIEKVINSFSIPALIYSNKKILFANELFGELIGNTSANLNEQPLNIFINTYDLSRVERYLEEVKTNSSFDCDIYDELNRSITVNMTTEFMLIDSVYSQLIFIQTKVKAKEDLLKLKNQELNLLKPVSGNLVNKSISGVLNFYLMMLRIINQKLFNQFLSPETYNPHEGAYLLTSLSGLTRKILEGVNDYNSDPKNTKLFSLKETIDLISTIFDQYFKLNKPGTILKLTGNLPSQKLAFSLQSFWIESILVRIIHLFADATEGNIVELECKQINEQTIEISISDNGTNLNLLSLDKISDLGYGALKIADINQLLENANCSLILESSLERGNKISMQLSIIDRGVGYDGALMDLSFHHILVFDSKNDFDTFQVAMKDTGANMIQVSDLQNSIKELEKQNISVIFLDMSMPEIDLTLFVSRVKNEYSEIPIIGLTKDGSHQRWKKNIQSGVDVFLGKPIDPKEVKETIKLFLT